jgi:hypothetical protein
LEVGGAKVDLLCRQQGNVMTVDAANQIGEIEVVVDDES